ncbi:hypothetical protein C0J52_24069 [Blattella germanica]|nr:hypothetical protein C0J52_24069 [Blattella germanica]
MSSSICISERNNEMVTATIDEGTTRKSTNLADMILNNFEEKLHSGHELQFSCLFPNDKDDKSLTSKSVNTNDNKIESTISNTSQSGLSEKEHSIDDKNKSSEHLTDNSLNSEVAQKSVTDETENTTEEISLNTAIKSEVDSKENCAKVKSGSDSSHSSSVPESNNEQSGMTQLDDSNHRAFSNEESEDILENTAKTDETQPHSEFLDMEVNNSEANETSDDVEMQNVSDVEMQNVSEQGVSDVEMQDDTSQLSSKSFDIDSQNKNGIPSTHVKKNVETVNLTQSSSNSEIFQIEPDTNSCQDLNAPNADNNSNSNERIINNQPKKMEVTETAASIPENTDIIEKKVEHLSNNNESTKSTSSNNTIAVETVNTQSQLIGTHTTSHSIPENTSSNNTANSIEVENSGVKTVFNNDSNDLKCTIDSGGSKSPLADPCIISNNETSTTSSDNAEDSVDIEIPLDEPGLVSNSEASASLDNAEESVGSEIQFVEPNTDSNNEASTSSGNAEDFVRSECPVIESQTDNDSESENNTVDCIEIESSVNKTDVNNESRNCSDSKNTVDSVGSEIPLAKADIVFNNESEASTSSDNAVDFVGSQNSLVEPDLIVDNKEADKVGQKRCFNLEENSEREAKRTRVEESRSNDSQSSSQCKTGNNSAVETNEQIDSSEIKEKKGSSESTSEISKLKIKDSDLLIKRSDVGKISNVTDRTNCSFELSKKDKILTKDCPIMPFGCKRVHEPGNIIEVKKVKFTPEMERHLSIINSSEKFQSKLLRRDIVSEVKKGEAKMGIKLDSKGTKDRLEGEVECKKSDNLTSAVISKNLTLDTSEKVLKTDKNEKLDTSPKDSEVEGKNISEKLEIKGNDEKPETEFSSKKLFSDTTIKKHNEEKSETTGGGEKCEIKSISEKMEITSSEKLESNNAFDKLLESKSVTETLQSEEAIKKFKTKDSLDKLESKDSEKVESKDPSEKYENKGASDNFRSIDVSEESESDVASEKSVDKSTSKKEENKDSSSKQSTTTREAESSVPPKSPKSNLDLAIERVALGLTDSDKEEEVEEEEDNSAVGSNPLPSVRNLRKNLLKNLSRFEWEELIMQKLTESISERSEVGDMRQRVQTQDQMLEYWRRKAQQLQKQRYIGDARTRKDRPIPVKITRSVGLQVHMGPVVSMEFTISRLP